MDRAAVGRGYHGGEWVFAETATKDHMTNPQIAEAVPGRWASLSNLCPGLPAAATDPWGQHASQFEALET